MQLPAWPKGLQKVFRPMAHIRLPDLDRGGMIDFLALRRARQLDRRIQLPGLEYAAHADARAGGRPPRALRPRPVRLESVR